MFGPTYPPRRPEEGLLHELLREHLSTLLSGLGDGDTGGLPRHVVRELEGFLECGVLAYGVTISRAWPGPDNPISIEPDELAHLVAGTRAVHAARGGAKTILPEEQPVIDFAYASIVAIKDIAAGERLDERNVWVKRPGTGPLHARQLPEVLGKVAACAIREHAQLAPADAVGFVPRLDGEGRSRPCGTRTGPPVSDVAPGPRRGVAGRPRREARQSRAGHRSSPTLKRSRCGLAQGARRAEAVAARTLVPRSADPTTAECGWPRSC